MAYNNTTVSFTPDEYTTLLTLGNQATADIQSAAASGQPAPVGVWQEMYNYIFSLLGINNVADPQTYWFSEAGPINDNELNNPAGFFVRDITALGLGVSLSSSTLQAASDAIGQLIFDTIQANFAQAGVASLSFTQQLTADVDAVVDGFGLNIGSWGGSFYYWDAPYNSTTVGAAIESSAQDTQVFVTNNAQAMANTILGFGLTELSNDPESVSAFQQAFQNLATGGPQAIIIGARLAIALAADVGTSVAEQFMQLLEFSAGDDMFIGAGSTTLSAGSGQAVLFGGQALGAVGNDTLTGGGGDDSFVFLLPASGSATETISDGTGEGQIIAVSSDEPDVLGGSVTQPLAAISGSTDIWEDAQHTTYTFSPLTDQLTIQSGALGGGNEILVDDFDVEAATSASGWLGLYFADTLTITAVAPIGEGPSVPGFPAGSTQSYTVSVDSPSGTAQTVTLTLAGASGSDFGLVTANGEIDPLSVAGTFTVTIPPGETSAAFSLANLVDLGSAATLDLTASIPNPEDPTGAAISSTPLSIDFTPGTSDTGSAPETTGEVQGLYDSVTGVTQYPMNLSIYSVDDLVEAGSGDNYIELGDTTNDSIVGGPGNNTIYGGGGDVVVDLQGATDLVYLLGTGDPNDPQPDYDTVNGGSGADSIYGGYGSTTGDAIINGNGGTDVISLPNGTDQIYAGSETDLADAISAAQSGTGSGAQGDFIAVGDGENTIVGGTGDDGIFVGTGNDVVVMGSGNSSLFGGVEAASGAPAPSSAWSIEPQDGIVQFDGLEVSYPGFNWTGPQPYNGNDQYEGPDFGSGNDTIYGGSGDDLIELPNGDNDVNLGPGNSTVQGGMGNDTLIGGSGEDLILGGGGNTYIQGGSGNSTIFGGDGNNTIVGSTGDDTIYSAWLRGDSSYEDTYAGATLEQNYVFGGSGDDLIYGSGGSDTLTGGSGNDTIYGGPGTESISGGSGNDLLVGGAGNDTIDAGGDGNDSLIATGSATSTTVIYGGDGLDSILGGSGSNVIYAGDGGTADSPTEVFADPDDSTSSTTIYGGLGIDVLQGGAGSNVIYAGDGGTPASPTQVIAGSGPTTVYGGLGTDAIEGGSGTDVLYAGDGGTDSDPTSVMSGTGIATIYGGAGAAILQDTLDGNDLLVGGSGDDTLNGVGNDTLEAGSGDDQLSGISGIVTDVFNPVFGDDEILQAGGSAALQFGSGIAVSDLTVTEGALSDGEAALEIYGDGGSILAAGGFTGDISGVSFADSPSLSIQQLIAQDGVDQTLAGSNGSFVFSVDQDASLTGGTGADTISAWGDEDTISASSEGNSGLIVYAAGDEDQVTGGSGADSLTAAGSNDSLVAGSANAQLTATGSAAVLTASAGNDTLTADGTADTLVSGSGDDEFVVNDGSTVIEVTPGSGSDSILSSVSYTLPVGVDTLMLTGSADLTATGDYDASNTLEGNAGNDTLIAGGGADTLIAGSGTDTLIGAGGDTFEVNNTSDVVQEDNYAANDTIVSSMSFTLPANVDTLELTGSGNIVATGNDDTANLIVGNSGADTLFAGSGDDTLTAGSGIDTLVGDGGAATFIVNNSADVVQESSSSANDTIDSSVSYVLPTNVDTLILTGSADVTGEGNDDASDVITGNSGNDELIAGSGADSLRAGDGVDTLVAGGGSDLLVGLAGDTYVLGANFGNTEIDPTTGSGTVEFGSGITPSSLTLGAVIGDSGQASLTVSDGGIGTTTIDGALDGSISQFEFAGGIPLSLDQLLSESSIGSTTLSGADGNFILNSETAASIVGGTGNDTIYGTGSGDTLVAGTGNQLIQGIGSGDVLVGGVGVDSLYGGAGDDTLAGGVNSTVMYGGTGDDTYVLEQGSVAEINPSATAGAEEIYLPTGMSFSDFSAYVSGDNLVLQSQDGATAAVINGYFSSTSDKTWFIAGDDNAPELLSDFINGSSQSSTSYEAEIDSLQQSYTVNLDSELEALGDEGGSLGSLIDLQGSLGDPGVSYTFEGVSTESLAVSGGVLTVGSSQDGTDTVQTQTQTHTVTLPVYGLETVPGASYVLNLEQLQTELGSSSVGFETPPGATAYPIYRGPTDPVTGQPTLSGYEIVMPSTTRLVQTGTTSETYTTSSDSLVSERGFTAYSVTGDGGNDTITASGPFTGTVVSGNGNVYVNLGTTSGNGQGDWISGDYPGTSAPLFDDGNQYAVQPGAFIEAGSGNDTLIGTNGDDVIAAGTGFDYMDGGNGADTYIVPMQGYSTDVIADSGNPAPALPSLLSAGGTETDLGGNSSDPDDPEKIFETPGPGQLPLDTLQLPAGITPENLEYRLFTSSEFPGDEVLQLNSGNSNVLIAFQPPPVYTDLRVAYVDFLFNPVTTPAQLGVDLVQFADGTELTLDQLMQEATELPNDFDPTVTGQTSNLQAGEPVAASALFNATDSAGNSITWYQISNAGTGGGYFALDGQAEPVGQSFMVNTAQLGQLVYVAGAAGSADSIQVSAFDGAVWSAAASSTVSVAASNSLQATAANQVVTGLANGPDTLTGGYAGDILVGQTGEDTFDYAAGGGAETIWETAAPSSNNDDTLQFGSGITPALITLSAAGSAGLVLSIGTAGDSVTLEGFDPTDPLDSFGVQSFDFADGTSSSLLQLLSDPAVGGSSGTLSNSDGSSTRYDFTPAGSQIYSAETVNAAGQLTVQYALKSDGSSSTSTYDYNADGSYTDTVVSTTIAGSVTTTVYGYSAQKQLLTEDVTNPDGSTADYTYDAQGQLAGVDITAANGSTSNSVYAHDSDGSYTETVTATPAGGSSTITEYTYDSERQLVSEDVANPDGSTADYTYNAQGQLLSVYAISASGSTSDSTYSYNADGSYTDTVVSTPAGGSATTMVYGYSAQRQLLTEDVTNPDGSTADYTYNTQGQLSTVDDTSASGSTSDSTYSYNADGSYTDTVVSTPAGGSATTMVYGYSAQKQLLTEDVTNPDGSTADYTYNAQGQLATADDTSASGSTSDSTYSHNADGSYTDTVVSTPAGGSATTMVYGYSAQKQLLTEDVTNPDGSTADYTYNTQGQLSTVDATNADGSTRDSTYAYNTDGTYSDTIIATPAGGGASTTTVYDYDAEGSLSSDNTYTPSADGSYTDSWNTNGGHGTYWWNSSTLEYQDSWYDSSGTYWTDDYQYAAGGSPGNSGSSFTETYTSSDGSEGTRQFDASSGITSLSWYSQATGTLTGTTSDAGFVGLQREDELTNTQPDLTFFNPAVSPSFSAFLAAH